MIDILNNLVNETPIVEDAIWEIKISRENAKWLINNKPYGDCSFLEKEFFSSFIMENKGLIQGFI